MLDAINLGYHPNGHFHARFPADLSIRGWLTDAGFVEQSFDAPADALFSVGVYRFVGMPQLRSLSAGWLWTVTRWLALIVVVGWVRSRVVHRITGG